MNGMKRLVLLMSILAAISIFAANGQSPVPVIVQAVSPAAIVDAPTSKPAAQDSSALHAAIKTLQEMKAANEEMLRKQEATLQQLDEIQKAAEQLKIFSKRG